MSIWEVRNNKQNFVYSKVMLWVAFDRGIRLAEKRNLPCPNRAKWLAARDQLMEEVMEKGEFLARQRRGIWSIPKTDDRQATTRT
jgi:GH15 family glucan-1,4-alpha-glucosidase